MFCQNCGVKNNDNDVFCGSCGAKLEKITEALMAQPQIPVKNGINKNGINKNGNLQAKKSVPKIFFVIAFELIAIILCGVSVKKAALETFSAKRVAEQYFVYAVNGNYEEAYDMLDLPQSEFLSKEFYIQSMEQAVKEDISEYRLTDKIGKSYSGWDTEESADNGFGEEVYIVYRIAGQDSDGYTRLKLTKSKEKQHLFFDDWKVADSSLWNKDVFIYVPLGADVKVDDVALSGQYMQENEDGEDVYKIPYLFKGKHKIEVSLEGYETVKSVFYEYDGYSLSHMCYTEDTIGQLQNLAIENMKKIYSAAVQNKDFSEIKELFTDDGNNSESIQNEYYSLVDSFSSDNYISTKFDSVLATSLTGNPEVVVNVTGNIKYYYEDWWSGTKSKENKNIDTKMNFDFTKENGNWVQTSLGCQKLYY